jgi:peptide chain release factor subunit 1
LSTKPDSVKLYKVRKLISELESKEGRGTELVSLYIPSKKPIHEAIANLREEWGTAGNIKSDTTRNHVQDALTRAMQRLKLYRTAPETGLVMFSGALPTNGPGSEVVNVYEIVPPKPVTQYLYQCLAPGTEVLLEDGTFATMKELKSDWQGQSVMSYDFDEKTLTGSRVKRYVKTFPGTRLSYELVVESGRRIQATEDHPFWTPRGWVRLKEIRNGDMVAVAPVADLNLKPNSIGRTLGPILDEHSLRSVSDPPKNFGLVVRRLKKMNLLPLTENNPKLSAIARLLGHLYSDGNLTRNIEQRKRGPYVYFTMDSSLGRRNDEDELRRDLSSLGYTPPRGREGEYSINIGEREYSARVIHVKVRNTAVITLLRALGAPVGSKVECGTILPRWLVDSRRTIKREFLSTYLGGDGEAPRIRKTNLSSGVRLSFHRIEAMKDEGLEFAEQFKQMMAEFGVVIASVSCTPSYTKKNGLRTVEILLRFKLSEENILKLSHGIGYRYSASKKAKADLVGEYLRIKSRLRGNAMSKLARAQEMRLQGVSTSQISSLLSLNLETATQWAQGRVQAPLVTSAQLPAFEEWAKLTKNGLEDPLIWETVVSKSQVTLADVRDLTVEQRSHSFIANGFLVHNCDDHYHLEFLKDMLREEKIFGLLSIDSSEVGLGILSGDRLEIPDAMTSGISGKTRKGGQSARRYERGREMELTYFFNRVGEHATRVFVDGAKVTGLIVGGPGPTKEEFLKGGYLHYELQKKVLAVIDTSYSGREGVRELVDKASETLQGVRLVEEKKLVQKFLGEVNRQGGLAVYGLPRVLDALKKANAEAVLVSDDLDTIRLEARCRKCGTVKSDVVQTQEKIQKKQELISEPCKSCGGADYDVTERDIVDILEEMAFQVGSKVEMISSGTEEGSMFKTFGGVAAILRYRPG